GIADARGLVAALALGAEAVILGTRFLAPPEANGHPLYKHKLVTATEADTVRTTLFGHGWPDAPHRTLRTPFVEAWLGQEARGNASRPDESVVARPRLRARLYRCSGLWGSHQTLRLPGISSPWIS